MRRYRQALAILLALSILLGMSVFPAAAAAVSDMPAETDWSYAALKAAMDNDLLRGDGGQLRPGALLTRSQLAAVVVRAFGARTTSDLTAYADVAASAWYRADMAKAVAMGVLNGNGGMLRPEDSVTRQEAFTILARAMKLSGGPASALDAYSDRADVAPWAEDAMAALIAGGYIQGNGAGLNPAAPITRAEFAQVMYQLVSSYIDVPGVYDKAAKGTVMVRAGGVTLKGVSLTRDLILGDGIGDGDVTLDSVTVAGRTVIRGGGDHSILVRSSSSLGAVIIDRPGGGVALKLQDKATVGSITICSNGVALSGIPKGTGITVNPGVTGATLEGTALPVGTSSAPGATVASGGGGGGGNPPVSPVATTDMTVSPAAAVMAAGTYGAALAVMRNTGANDTLAWSSSDETVAVVDANGRVGAKKSGEAVIAVQSASGVVASATVYVQEPTGENITISVPGTVLTGGSYTTITVAASVGTGDYTLNGVTVGTLETHGGGIHSGHIAGGSVGAINMQETPVEGSRVLLSGGAVVGAVNVDGAAGGAALEVASGSSASVGSVTSNAPLTVTNTTVITSITAAGVVSLTNSSAPILTTFGSTPAPVTLSGSSVGTLNAGAAGGTLISSGSGGAILPMIFALGSVTTEAGVGVGTIDARSDSSRITTNGPVGSITGTVGPVSLNNSGNTAITADAGSVSVSGASAPVVSGTVSGITVNANPEGSSGVTVLAGSPSIATAGSGSGSVGLISVGGSATSTITAGAPIGAVTVTGIAAPTVGGTAQVGAVVSSSSGTTTVSNTNTASVLATNTATVIGATAQAAVITLQSIAVTTYPTKLNYALGETLNTAGMVVTGYYTVTGFDGTVSRVLTAGTDYAVGTVDMSAAGMKAVTVTASDKTASFPVNVVARTVGFVAVTTLPTNLVHEKGATLNLTGGELTVVYTDSTAYPNVKVSLTDGMVSGYSASAPGVQTLTVTYEGKTAVFTVMVKDSLGEAKAAAKNELNAHAATTLASATYSAAGRATIETARKNGETAIGVAVAADVTAALNAAKGAITAVPNQAAESEAAASAYQEAQSAILGKTPENVTITDKAAVNKALVAYAALEAGVRARLTAEKTTLDVLLARIAVLEAAQTLEAAKATAEATLNAAYTNYNSGYTTNRETIDAAKAAGHTAISAAASVAAVTAALDRALAAMAAVKSDAALLAEAKAAATAALNTYAADKSKGDYDAAGKAAIEAARKSGGAAITAAADTEAISGALSTAKAAIELVKTTVTVAAEKLAAAKTAAKAELETYKSTVVYRANQKSDRDAAVASGKSAIDSAANTAAVTTALTAAKAAIDLLKTDAQLTAEELAAAKTAAKAAIAGYKVKGDYSPAGWALITNIVGKWQATVDACTVLGQVSAGEDGAKAELRTVTTAAQEKAANQSLVDSVKTAVEGAEYTAVQAQVSTEAQALAAIKAIVDGKHNAAVTAVITKVSYTPAVAGDADAPAGNNGSCVFAVNLTAGKAAQAGYGDTSTSAVTGHLTLAITATAYTGVSNAEAVTAALTAVNGADYGSVAQSTVNSETDAENYVKAIAVAAVANASVTVTIKKTAFTAAVAGSQNNAAGTNGSYVFTVTVSKGAQSQTSGEKTLVITAAKVLSRADLAVALYDALKERCGLDGDTTVKHSFTDLNGLSDEAKSAISFCYNNGLAVGVSNTAFMPNGAVLRAEAAAVLARIVPAVTGFELERTVNLTDKYTDVASNAWYYDSVMAMGGAGVFPMEDLFRPQAFITPDELSAAVSIFKGKLDALYSTSVRVTDEAGLAAALGASEVRYIRLTGDATLEGHVILDADKALAVGKTATLTVAAGCQFEVRGRLNTEAGSTVWNNSLILVGAGGVLNNAGAIVGRWVDDPNSENPDDGWYESCVATDLVIGTKRTGTVHNTGTIQDTLLVSDYLADTQGEGDVLGGFLNTGKVTRIRPVAVVKTTAALKRALANRDYAEIDCLGAFELTESVTVPEYVQLLFPKAWEEEGSTRIDTSLTINTGVTLTIAAQAELIVNCGVTINGAVENHGYFGIRNSGQVTGGIRINNSGTVQAESVYAQGKTLVALDGCSGDGELRHTAYVHDGSLLGAAADNTSVSDIMITAEGEVLTVTMSGDVTIRPNVWLNVPVFVDDNNPSATRQSVTLVIPSGASLTANGVLNVAGIVEVRAGGTLTLNGEVSLREKRNASFTAFGTLKNDGSVTLGENASLDCGGNIITTGTFTNNGEIRTHSNFGTDYPQYGTVTGTIMGNQPICVAIVDSEGELKAALSDTKTMAIRVVGDIALTDDVTLSKTTVITQGRVTVANHRLTVADDVIVAQDGTLNFYAETGQGLLTVNAGATLRAMDGGRLIIGREEETGHAPSAEGSVVNNGSIESRHSEIRFVDAEEWQILSGNSVVYYANRSDLVRILGRQLRDYLVQPVDSDFRGYGVTYSDWGDMCHDDGNDEDAIWGYALLLKNGIVSGTDGGRLSPYGDLDYLAMKALFSRIAVELLGETYTNAAVTAFLDDISPTGPVTYSHREYTDSDHNYWDNSLNKLTRDFIEALGLYRANVRSAEELAAALEKPYVTEIRITADFTLNSGTETRLTEAHDSERTVIVASGATLTILRDARLTVERGAVLELNGKLVNNGGMDVFGGLRPDNWWVENSEHYEQGEGAYINFYPDFLDFARRLHERVAGQGLEPVNPEEIQDRDSDGWPYGDDREGDFAFLVEYGGVQRKVEGDHTWWPAYDKVNYGELKGILEHVYQAICGSASTMPGSVKLEYDGSEKNNEDLVNDRELNELLDLFIEALSPRDGQ